MNINKSYKFLFSKLLILFIYFILYNNVFANNNDIKVEIVVNEKYGCNNCTIAALNSTIHDLNSYFNYPEIKLFLCRNLYLFFKNNKIDTNVFIYQLDKSNVDILVDGLTIYDNNDFPLLQINNFKEKPIMQVLQMTNLKYINLPQKDILYKIDSSTIITYSSPIISVEEGTHNIISFAFIEPLYNKLYIIKNNQITNEIQMIDTLKYYYGNEHPIVISTINEFLSYGRNISSFTKILSINDSTLLFIYQTMFDLKSSIVWDSTLKENINMNSPILRNLLVEYNYINNKIMKIIELDSNFYSSYFCCYNDNNLYYISKQFFQNIWHKSNESLLTISEFPIIYNQRLKNGDYANDKIMYYSQLIKYVDIKQLKFEKNTHDQIPIITANNNHIILNVNDYLIDYEIEHSTLKIKELLPILPTDNFNTAYQIIRNSNQIQYDVLRNLLIYDTDIYFTTNYRGLDGFIKYTTIIKYDMSFNIKSYQVINIENIGNYNLLHPILISGTLYYIGLDNKNLIYLINAGLYE